MDCPYVEEVVLIQLAAEQYDLRACTSACDGAGFRPSLCLSFVPEILEAVRPLLVSLAVEHCFDARAPPISTGHTVQWPTSCFGSLCLHTHFLRSGSVRISALNISARCVGTIYLRFSVCPKTAFQNGE